jgi:predicted TIM-barrel fold metal-dependent hydrolase
MSTSPAGKFRRAAKTACGILNVEVKPRLLLWGAAVILVAGALSPARAQVRAPIIDMHMHTHHPTFIPSGAPSICRPAPCQGKGAATATEEQSLRGTLAQMDRYNIVKGLVSGTDLAELERWSAAAPGRFVRGVFMTTPEQPRVDILRREVQAGRIGFVGEVATQLTGVAPNDPRLAPYFAMAAELNVPVLIHTEGIGPELPGFRSAAGNPLLLEPVLVRHPNLRIYVENTGYPFLGEMLAIMTQYPNNYGDLSTITWELPREAFYRDLKALVDAGLGKRLMFGSDQMRWPEAIGWAVQAIEEAPFLSEAQKRHIFYNNAARFLRMGEAVTSNGSPDAGLKR